MHPKGIHEHLNYYYRHGEGEMSSLDATDFKQFPMFNISSQSFVTNENNETSSCIRDEGIDRSQALVRTTTNTRTFKVDETPS